MAVVQRLVMNELVDFILHFLHAVLFQLGVFDTSLAVKRVFLRNVADIVLQMRNSYLFLFVSFPDSLDYNYILSPDLQHSPAGLNEQSRLLSLDFIFN